MRHSSKHVVLAFRTEGEPGRRKLGAILEYIREQGLDWHLHIVRSQEDFSPNFIRSLNERRIDGVIFSIPKARAGAKALAELDIPTIAVDLYDETLLAGRQRNLVFINGSSESVGQAAARNLLAQGCFNGYGFVPDLGDSAWGRQRGAAFLGEIAAHGLAYARYHARSKSYDLPELATWLKRLPRPAGVFVAFDDRALQVLEACHEAHLAVPDDIAVIGVDNDEMLCLSTDPPLSSVQPNHVKIVQLAVRRLAEMMNGKALPSPQHESVAIREVVIRQSTSAVSHAGMLVQRAMAFIRAHAAEAVKPRDVAKYLKVSRSLADLRFREVKGESIGATILRLRLEEVRRQLLITSDTIENIAARCQFKRRYRLDAAFAKAFGATPAVWRQRN